MTREIRLSLPERHTIGAVLGLAGIAAVLLRHALFAGQVFYDRDLHLQWFGQVETFVRSIAAGSWPLWDPYVSFGQPLLANANNQILYPPTWLHLVVRPWTYYTVYFFAHLVFAGLGLYRLAERLRVSRSGAFVAGALWVASGPLLSLGNAWNHLAAVAWMPWVGLAAVTAADLGTARAALVWGAAWGAQILAGSPDVFVMTGCLVVTLLADRVDWRRLRARANVRLVALAVLAAGFALALSAAQWVPSADLASRSGRVSAGTRQQTYWSVHPASLLQMVVPLRWDELPLNPVWRSLLFESREPFLLSTYVGLPAALLAAVGLANPRGWRVGVLALLIASVLVAFGRHAPFHGAALFILPPLRVLRFPAKALVLAGFCGALLAGQGFDEWRRARDAGPFGRRLAGLAALAACVAAALAGVTYWKGALWSPFLVDAGPGGRDLTDLLRPAVREATWASAIGLSLWLAALARGRGAAAARLSAALVAGVGVADLAWNHKDLNPTAPRIFYSSKPEAVASIDQKDFGRLFVYDYTMDTGRSDRHLGRDVPYVVGLEGGGPRWAGAFGMRMYLVPPTGAAWDLYGSYEKDSLGLQPRPLAELNALLARADDTPMATRLLRLGAVSQVLALHTEGFDGLGEVKELPGPFFEPMHLLAVPRPLPRSYVVDGVRRAAGHEALEALIDVGFDPEAEVVLAGDEAPREHGTDFRGGSRITVMAPDRVVLEAQANAPAHLVLVDGYDPGWLATVDGEPATVVRANVAFRGVAITAGRHVVEFLYRPRSVVWGLWMSACALVAGAAFVLRTRKTAAVRG